MQAAGSHAVDDEGGTRRGRATESSGGEIKRDQARSSERPNPPGAGRKISLDLAAHRAWGSIK